MSFIKFFMYYTYGINIVFITEKVKRLTLRFENGKELTPCGIKCNENTFRGVD